VAYVLQRTDRTRVIGYLFIGVVTMRLADGVPESHAAPRPWEKMLQATGNRGQSDFLSTHPQSEKRQEALAALMPQMMPYYEDKSPRPEYRLKTA
jgi:hypothetical protein